MQGTNVAVGEYLIIFAAILIGLAVADLSFSLHRLLRHGRSIQWHPIVPLVGFLVLCFILNLWWGLYRISQVDEFSFIQFLPNVFMLLTLFLLAAAVFPDEKLEKGASLLEYYLDSRKQIWGLFSLYFVIVVINRILDGVAEGITLAQHFDLAMENVIGALMCFGLMWTRSMIAHWAVVIFGLVITGISWSGATLQTAASG